MSVDLDPPELGFRRPFTQEVAQTLRLSNPNSDPVAFKVKTTAPKQYCVRPNSGRIETGGHVEVQVLLQAMKEDPPPDARCRDKFLVQSVAISPDNDAANVAQIWANIDQNAKSSVQEKKIRVSFLPAGAAVNGTSALASSTHNEEEPPAYSFSSPSRGVTPQKPSASDVGDESMVSTVAAQSSAAAAAVTSAVPTSQEELKQQLDDAKATISRLQTQTSEGLRQRKPQEAIAQASEKVSQSLQNAPAPGGVPIQIVALLCLLCFLLAYFFF